MNREMVMQNESEFLELVASGESAASASLALGMSKRWAYERAGRNPDFAARLAEAREAGRQARKEMVMGIALSMIRDPVCEPQTDADGRDIIDEETGEPALQPVYSEQAWRVFDRFLVAALKPEGPASAVQVNIDQRQAPSVAPAVLGDVSATDKARRLLSTIEDADVIAPA